MAKRRRTKDFKRLSAAAKKGWQTRRRNEALRAAANRERARESRERLRSTTEQRNDLEDIAEALGVDADDLAEDLGLEPDEGEDFWDTLEPEDFDDVADDLDIDVSDIYDMYYGYVPGSRE